jgi:hypothetical protein
MTQTKQPPANPARFSIISRGYREIVCAYDEVMGLQPASVFTVTPCFQFRCYSNFRIQQGVEPRRTGSRQWATPPGEDQAALANAGEHKARVMTELRGIAEAA